MTDPLTYLAAALDAAQRDAEAAAEDGTPVWSTGRHHAVRDENDDAVAYDEGRPTPAQAAHIAANDPAAVLRRIAADRKTLAEHRADGKGRCGRCAHWDTIWDAGRVAHRGRPYPCTTVRNMAEGWGWTEETT